MELWLPVTLLSVGVLAWLLLPGMKHAKSTSKRADYDINVYKDQLAELDREAAEGRIEGQELEAARLEIQKRLLAASEDKEQSVKEGSTGGTLPIFIAAGAAPVLAVVFYMYNGSPEVPDHPLAERTDIRDTATAQSSGHVGQQAPSMEAALKSLEQRLQENPNDVDGWILLARSYAGIGQVDKAAAAYARAVPLSERHPMLLADWAEARLNVQQGQFTQEIFNDFVEARMRDPSLPKPWFYIGLDMAMGGNFKDAVQTWTDLLHIAPGNPQFTQALRAEIDKAAAEGGIDPKSVQPSETAKKIVAEVQQAQSPDQPVTAVTPPSASAPSSAPGPSQEDVQAAQEMSAEDRSAFIRSMVERLAGRLEENPNDPEGWQRLIRAYEVLGETDKAAAAREKLATIQAN